MGGTLEYRYNAMQVSTIRAFYNVNGGLFQNSRDVYFVRAIGTNAGYQGEVLAMDEFFTGAAQERRGIYKRITKLPVLAAVEDAAYYSACYAQWAESGKRRVQTKTAEKETICRALGAALVRCVGQFGEMHPNRTASIEKNFVVKLLFWFDAVMAGLLHEWDERSVIKIVAENIVKEQEYLFFYLLTNIGVDVLLLQYEKDISQEVQNRKLSAQFVLGASSAVTLPEQRSYVHTSENCAPKVQIPRRSRASRADNTKGEAPEREKSFEELAHLASSVVMIAMHDRQGSVVGTGSGIMIGKKGYILTNHHVAGAGDYYSIRIEDEEEVYQTDEMIKYNPVLDLAVIRIQRELKPIPLYGGRNKLVRGQRVVAIGSPLGLFNSVSDGIISGFRVIDNVDMIQFTAPISHGSSGGALLNLQGELIGISTAGIDRGQNINLAMGYDVIQPFISGFV